MHLKHLIRKIGETFAVSALIGSINLIFPDNGAFVQIYGVPYLLAALVFARFYGLRWGAVSLLWSTLALTGLAWIYPGIHGGPRGVDFAWAIFHAYRYSGPLTVLSLLALSFLRSRMEGGRVVVFDRIRRLTKENWSMKRKAKAIEMVNRVLESRLSSQKDAMTLLYTQLKKLRGLNIQQALATLLETVHLFTAVKSASVWEAHQEGKKLSVVSTFGWDGIEDRLTEIPMEETIEGWVFRNGSVFSVRMVLQYDHFTHMDSRRSIIALPIIINRKVWGVLNIEDLPFEQYSLYTERVLQIILNLAEPMIEPILEHEALFEKSETDQDTGLPLFSQFYKALSAEIKRLSLSKGLLSIIILEIANFSDLCEEFPRVSVKKLFNRLIETIQNEGKGDFVFFHFKSDSQLALLASNMDFDGASFFCLDLLSMIPSLDLEVDGQAVPLEIIVGYASSRDSQSSPELLIEQAENLLEMQKV